MPVSPVSQRVQAITAVGCHLHFADATAKDGTPLILLLTAETI